MSGWISAMNRRTDAVPTTVQIELDSLMPIIREQLALGQSVRFSPRGVSMLPMLRQGIDSVTLSPLPPRLKKYDLPLYRRADGKYILHRIVEAGETYTCIGDNQFVCEPGVTHGQMIALVTEFFRNGRACRVDSPAYRLYCIFWHHTRPVRHFWRRGIGWLRRHIRN